MGLLDRRGTAASALGAAALVVVLSGCGQTAVGVAAAPAAVEEPEPIPVVEPTCIADYGSSYGSAAQLVAGAAVVVRASPTGASRDYKSYPLPPTSDDPATSPQTGMSPEEFAQFREEAALDLTAITVRVVEVIKGDVAVGDLVEVSQNTCTERPLPTDEGRDYLLALASSEPGTPMSQLSDSGAAWQVRSDRTLVPVHPEDDLGVTSVDQLAALATGVGAGAAGSAG